jgi:hypothetical protein
MLKDFMFLLRFQAQNESKLFWIIELFSGQIFFNSSRNIWRLNLVEGFYISLRHKWLSNIKFHLQIPAQIFSQTF